MHRLPCASVADGCVGTLVCCGFLVRQARLQDVNALVKIKNPSLLLQLQKVTRSAQCLIACRACSPFCLGAHGLDLQAPARGSTPNGGSKPQFR